MGLNAGTRRPQDWKTNEMRWGEEGTPVRQCNVPGCKTLTMATLCERHRRDPNAPVEEQECRL